MGREAEHKAPVGRLLASRAEELLQALREGFSLCEMIRDENGKVVDYWIREGNDAYLYSFGGVSALNRRLGELRPDVSKRWFATCGNVVDTGVPSRFEYLDPRLDRWYDVHLTPVGDNELIQLYVDVTKRKRAEERQLALFNELNHRVKNNLNVVTAMLSLQAKNAPKEVRQALQQAVDRIHTIAEVHAILYRSGSIEHVQLAEYLVDLCGRIGASLADDRVRLKVEAERADVTMDTAVQLGIIVNELITNALKHAYPAPNQGVVTISFQASEGRLDLTVRDDGPGMPANDLSPGLGMKLVRSLVANCGGDLVIESVPGATIRVSLPT